MIKDSDIMMIDPPDLTANERMFIAPILSGMKVTLAHMAKSFVGGRITIQYPEEKREVNKDTYRGVHRLNRDEDGRVACVACFMCATACPANCIHIEGTESPWPDREKYPAKFDIDELRCIYCGMCEEACPVDAIELTHNYDLVGKTREELILGKDELLSIFDATKGEKPRKNPRITGYLNTGDRKDAPADVTNPTAPTHSETIDKGASSQ